MTKSFPPLLLISLVVGSASAMFLALQSDVSAKEVCRNIPGIGRRCILVPTVPTPTPREEEGATGCFFQRPIKRTFHLMNKMSFPMNLKVNNDSYTIPSGQRWVFTSNVTSGGDCGGTKYGNPVVSFDDDTAPGFQAAKYSIPENRDYYFGTFNEGRRIGLYPQ
ncbi:hypothetical protein AB3R30_03205 [Leptolyngbyaceae cyanobacterium UHCC 1019]